MDSREIIDTNTQKKTVLGQYFFSLFNSSITQYFLKIPNMLIYNLFTKYSLNDQTLKMILEILKTTKNEKM